jgi:alpha-glucan,water dikinase
MAVLVMHVVPAEYAFVIHTTNPITRDAGEIYCELVKGLGETLVSGQFPGRSLAFRCTPIPPTHTRTNMTPDYCLILIRNYD